MSGLPRRQLIPILRSDQARSKATLSLLDDPSIVRRVKEEIAKGWQDKHSQAVASSGQDMKVPRYVIRVI